MTMQVVRVRGLPEAPLAAAAEFYTRVVPTLQGDTPLVLILPPADHQHRGWRAEVVASLARQFAPARVNAVVGDDEAAIAAATRWLADAPGVTGQVLQLDGQNAGVVVS